METIRGRPLVSPQKTETPKLRKRLQKNVAKLRQNSVRRLGASTNNDRDPANKHALQAYSHSHSHSHHPLPDPDLSDVKWAEYLRSSRHLEVQLPPVEHPKLHLNIIPEFSHLAIKHDTPRSSLDTGSQRSQPSPSSASSALRRRAKTPIFSIGQLEGMAVSRPRNALARDKTSSVELIADQYRALLDSRSSIYTESHSEPLLSPQHGDSDRPSWLEVRRQYSSDGLRGQQTQTQHRASAALPTGSPTSDDGTLVSFEEETVYFKPVSFSPEPLSPAHELDYHRPVLSPSVAPDNLSLQICLDLLTRDLASAITSRPNRSSPKTSALQVWVMIEAYERLRDQLLGANLRCDEIGPLEIMFDMWLRALYSVHDSLTERETTVENDFEGLESEDLD